MNAEIFTADYKRTPYWWDRTPRPALPDAPLPAAVDVAVVGSGYTGLNAALQTARGGRDTLVFDAEAAGHGCSSRNGGQISTSIKPGYGELARRHGPERAHRILREGHNALAWIGDFVAQEAIDCDFAVSGRFHAAHNPQAYEQLARELEEPPEALRVPAYMVARADQRRELGTDAYHGGVVYERHAALDPGRYHAGLLQRALDAGVEVRAQCPVTGIAREGEGFELATPRGRVRAREVIVATNGYTGAITPWQRRRVIPIGSYMIATEPLPAAQMDRLMPRDRVISDSRRVVYYYRASPDRRRILFGGRVTGGECDPDLSGRLLRADLIALFPELATVKISHSWMGFVAYTFDTLAHLGRHDGLHFAMGYCGSGVSMASYLGNRIGRQLLGDREAATGLDGVTFQTRPFYSGNPWFLAASVQYYRWRDRRNW